MRTDKAVYILHGSASLLLEEALKNLTNEFLPQANMDFNYDVFDAEMISPAQVVAAANTLPVFADKRLVVVRRAERYFENRKSVTEEDDPKEEQLESSEQENTFSDEGELLAYAKNPNPMTKLILVASKKLDSRKKFFKELAKSAEVLAFNELNYKEAVPWLTERAKTKYGKKLAHDAAQFLTDICGRDPGILAGELEKLALYCADKKEITLPDAAMLCGDSGNVVVFDILDYIITKRTQKALEMIKELTKRGEHPVKIIAALGVQIRSLLAVRALKDRGLNSAEIAAALGSKSDYFIQKQLKQAAHFETGGLITAISLLAECDANTKMGLGEGENLLLNTLVRIGALVK